MIDSKEKRVNFVDIADKLENKDITQYDNLCDLVINDSIGKVFEGIEKELNI